jgi:hypothetical protein
VDDVVDGVNPRGDRSLIALIRELPSLLIALIKAELNQLTQELSSKAKHAGIGIGMFVGAAVFVFFAVGVLLAAAVLGLAVVLPAWLSALIVGVALLVIAGVLALLGRQWFKRAMPLAPHETIESVKEDVEAIKGMGKYDQ